MIEIVSIFAQFLIFLLIFSFPFTPKILNDTFKVQQLNFSLIDAHSINIIFFIYFCLFFSFLNIDLTILFRIYFLLSLIFIALNFRKLDLNFKKLDLLFFFIFSVLIISIFFSIAQNLKLEWDGHHWIEKVLVFFKNNEIKDLKNVLIHNHYPHLGSYIWAFFWKNSYLEFEYFGRFFYVYFYIVAIFLIFSSLKLDNKIIKLFAILFLISITYEPYLFAGYQEYLIFSSLIFASRFISMINFKAPINLRFIFLILLILYTICWFKDEGVVYFLIFSIILIKFLNISNFSKVNLIFCLIGLLLIQYVLQKYLIGIYDFPQKTSIFEVLKDITNMKILFTKLSQIFIHCVIAFIKYPLWLVIFASCLVQFFFINKIETCLKYFLVCLLFNLAFIISIFFTFNSFDFMLRVSLDRLLFQTSGFYIPLILLSLRDIKVFKK
tara:strand:- start:638 stop:1951 length:1314 start_codon:yes stop_codon:yes gene_type:complete